MRKACRICTGRMEREMNKETESGKTYPDDIKSEGPEKKDIAKAYEKYAKQFTPKPDYFGNCLKAFLVGGLICTASLWYKNMLMDKGIGEEDAAVFVTITLVALAQILTGLGVFDVIAKFAGAGVIVPITGFANSMVAPALEYKKEERVIITLSQKCRCFR